MFLSSTYKQFYDNSKKELEEWEKKQPGKAEAPKEERRKAKGALKMYKSKWILDTMKRQQENAKLNRR